MVEMSWEIRIRCPYYVGNYLYDKYKIYKRFPTKGIRQPMEARIKMSIKEESPMKIRTNASMPVFVSSNVTTDKVEFQVNVDHEVQDPKDSKSPRNWEIRLKIFNRKKPIVEIITASSLEEIINWIKKGLHWHESKIESLKLRQLRRVDLTGPKV